MRQGKGMCEESGEGVRCTTPYSIDDAFSTRACGVVGSS